jgi:hypothetical protein
MFNTQWKNLNLPIQASGFEKLGRLRNLYGFDMEDVRNIIENN